MSWKDRLKELSQQQTEKQQMLNKMKEDNNKGSNSNSRGSNSTPRQTASTQSASSGSSGNSYTSAYVNRNGSTVIGTSSATQNQSFTQNNQLGSSRSKAYLEQKKEEEKKRHELANARIAQKNGTATKAQKDLIKTDWGETAEGAVKRKLGGHLTTIGDLEDMLKSDNKSEHLQENMGKLTNKDDSELVARQRSAMAKKLTDEGNKQIEDASKGATGLKKAALSAEASGVEMLMDQALGPAWWLSMASSTYGNALGDVEKQGGTKSQDRLNAGLQALKEVGTEYLFAGAGLAKKAIGGKGLFSPADKLADRIAGALADKGMGKLANAASIGVKTLGGTLEENLEEVAGWALDPVIANQVYGNDLQAKNEQAARSNIQSQSQALRNEVMNMSPDEVNAVIANLNSDQYLETVQEEYIKNGAPKEQAIALAEQMRDYLAASISGDDKTAADLENAMVNTFTGGVNSVKKKWDFGELAETIQATTLLTLATGAPGAAIEGRSLSQTGSALKEQLGVDGVKALTKSAMNVDDENMSIRAQAMRDAVDNGKELSDYQIGELARAQEHQIQIDTQRQDSAFIAAQSVYRAEGNLDPIVMDGNGGIVFADKTAETFKETKNRVLESIKGDDRLQISEEDLDNVSTAITGYQTGVLTVGMTNELMYDNQGARTAFEEETGETLPVIRDRKGNVDITATNVATKEFLFKNASKNLIKTAEAETVDFRDRAKGEIDADAKSRMGAKGQQVFSEITDNLDVINSPQYIAASSVASTYYAAGRNGGFESFDTLREAIGTQLDGYLSEADIRKAYDAGVTDREIAEKNVEQKAVKIGEAINDIPTDWKGNGTVINEVSSRTLRDSEYKVFEALAYNLGVTIHLVDHLNVGEQREDGTYAQANGQYIKGEIWLNINGDPNMNIGYVFMHEVTHHIKAYAPTEFAKLENLVRANWSRKNPVGMQRAIKERIDLYAKHGQTLSEEAAMEEIIADSTYEMLQDRDFVAEACEDISLGRSILNAIRFALKRLRAIFAENSNYAPKYNKALLSQLDILKEAEQLWLEGLTASIRNQAYSRINAMARGNIDYSPETLASEEENEKFSIVNDEGLISSLEADTHKVVYRAMAKIDGKLYPPMASREVDDETKGRGKKNSVMREGIELGQWVEADQETRSAMFNDKNQYHLIKDNLDETDLWVSYNPYIHSSDTMINDQFSSYYKRDNVVVVEGEIPTSELTSGYRAVTTLDDGRVIEAKDTTGTNYTWNKGPVSNALKDKGVVRTVYLTNHFKPTRIVPSDEVARHIADRISNYEDISVPYNVVPNAVRKELLKLGTRMTQSTTDTYHVELDEEDERLINQQQALTLEHEMGSDVKFSITTLRTVQPKTIPGQTKVKFTESGINVLKETMGKNRYTKEQIQASVDFLESMADFIEEELSINFTNIGWESLDPERGELNIIYETNSDGTFKLDKNGRKIAKSVVASAMVKNGEYPVNFDFTTICNKREAMMDVIDQLTRDKDANTGKRVINSIKLSSENMWKINEALKNEGLDTACLGCFVEARRYNTEKFLDAIDEKWNKSVRATRRKLGLPEDVFFDFAEGGKPTAEDYLSVSSLWGEYDEVKEKGAKSTPAKRIDILMQKIIDNNDVNSPYLKQISPADVLTSEGIAGMNNLSTDEHNLVTTIKSIYGTSAPKEIRAFTPYNSEIALLADYKGSGKNKQTMLDYLYGIGGARIQSFSDFKIENVLDYMQMVADLAARKFPAHAYTKVLAFAKIFGKTGIKINMSVMFDTWSSDKWKNALNCTDEEAEEFAKKYAGMQWVKKKPKGMPSQKFRGGYLTYLVGDKVQQDAVYQEELQKNLAMGMSQEEAERAANKAKPYEQSISYLDAAELQKKDGYRENCGIIAVAYSDEHFRMLLDDENVRYIIPYHKSGLPKFISEKTSLEDARDFTLAQNTDLAKGGIWYDKNGNGKKLRSKFAEYVKSHPESEYPGIDFMKELADEGWYYTAKKKTTSEKGKLHGTGEFNVYKSLRKAKQNNKSVQAVADEYIADCISKNQVPVFWEFAGHPNYYKTLFDFAVTDGKEIYEQGAVRDEYDSDIKNIIREGAKEQDQKNALKKARMSSVMDTLYGENSEESLIADTNINPIRYDVEDQTNPKFSPEEDEAQYSITSEMNSDKPSAVSTIINSPEAEDFAEKYSLTAATFFSGAGTLDYALKDVISSRMAVEYDRVIGGVYRENNGDQVIIGDVRDVDINPLSTGVEYFHASPVCKNFSRAKIKGEETDTDITTAQAVVDALHTMQDLKVFTLENVPQYKGSQAYNFITEALDELGYTWDVDVYKDSDFGGYTKRQRLFIRAVKDGNELPPKPEKTPQQNGWKSAVADLYPTLKRTAIPNWMQQRLDHMDIDVNNLEEDLFVIHGNKHNELEMAKASEVLPTILARSTDAKIITTEGEVLDVSGRVMARLSGLDDNFKLPSFKNGKENKTRAIQVVGNGIPVKLSQAVVIPLVEVNDMADHETNGITETGQFSITPEIDQQYLDAVNNGNMETAQRMVDEAAKNAGYAIRAYHGTNGEFTVFDIKKSNDVGAHFADNLETPQQFAYGDNGKVLNVYLKGDPVMIDEDFFSRSPEEQANPLMGALITLHDADVLDYDDTYDELVRYAEWGDAAWDEIVDNFDEENEDSRGDLIEQWNEHPDVREFWELLNDTLMSKGDLMLEYENEVEGGNAYVVFNAADIKSADPVTYDDAGNIIPLSERFNEYNPDIRYSLATTDDIYDWISNNVEDMDYVPSEDPLVEEGRVRMAKSKGEAILNARTKWNERWYTENIVLDTKSVTKNIRDLIMGVMANSDTSKKYKTELVDMAVSKSRHMYYLMKQGKDAEAGEIAWEIGTYIVENADFIDDSMYVQYKDLRDYLRTTRIVYPAQFRNDLDYNEIRKHNMGRLRLANEGVDIDSVWQELNDRWPEWFKEDVEHPAEMLETITDVLDKIQPYKIAYTSEEAASLIGDIADSLFDIVQEGKEYQSTADQFKARYDKQTKALKERHREAKKEVRKESYRRGYRKGKKKGLEWGKQIGRTEGRREGRVEGRKKQIEKQKSAKERAKHFGHIQDNYDWLTERLLTPTKDKNIPEQFRTTLAHMLIQFDLQTKRSKKLEEKYGPAKKTIAMRELKARLEEISNTENTDDPDKFNYNGFLMGLMDNLATRLDGATIDALETADLVGIDEMLKMIKHEFLTYGRTVAGIKSEEIAKYGQSTIDAMNKKIQVEGRRKTYGGATEFFNNLLNEGESTPVYFFERLGGGIEDMYKELRRGEDRYIENIDYIKRRFTEITKNYNARPILNHRRSGSELENWRNSKGKKTFKVTHGEVTMTIAQVMSLYCHAKRPQSMGHITGRGVVITPIRDSSALRENIKGRTDQAVSIMLTEDDVKSIISTLTPEQIKMADEFQSLLNNEMAMLGNETAMQLYGTKLFREKNYFPITSASTSLAANADGGHKQAQRIRNFGFTKDVIKGANNALEIDDIFHVVAEHCNSMALYNALAAPLQDFLKVYNYKTVDENGQGFEVQSAIKDAFSVKANRYIEKFLTDVNGATSVRSDAVDSLMKAALGRYKVAALAANLRVLAQQPTAIVRALMEISPKYFVGNQFTPKDMQEMFDHCPIAKWKSWGNYEMDLGRDLEAQMMNQNESWADFIGMGLYGLADNMTWTAIWKAVKREVEAKNPNLEKGSQAYWDAVNKRASEVFDKTQVVDSIFHRSDSMRSGQTLTKITTAFMAEPTLTYNCMRSTLVNAVSNMKTGKAGKGIASIIKMGTVLTLSGAFTGGMAALVDAMYGKGDDDDKMSYWERWYQNFINNTMDNLNPFKQMYVVKDFADLFGAFSFEDGELVWERGDWGTSNMALEGIASLASGINDMIEYINGNSKKTFSKCLANMATGFGYVFGIPVKTMLKELDALMTAFGVDIYAAVDDASADLVELGQDKAVNERRTPSKKDDSSSSSSSGSSSDSTSSSSKSTLPSIETNGTEDDGIDASRPTFYEPDGRSKKSLIDRLGIGGNPVDREYKSYLKEVKKLNKSVEGLTGEDRIKALWQGVNDGYKNQIAEGDLSSVEYMRRLVRDASGYTGLENYDKLMEVDAYVDKQLQSAMKSAYKKTIGDPDRRYDQYRYQAYMINTLGMKQDDISEVVYKSESAKDLKAAFCIGDADAIKEEGMMLVSAGLTQEDYQKAYDNRWKWKRENYSGKYKEELERMKSTGEYAWPVSGSITSHFGYRSPGETNGKGSTNHQGIDIGVSTGTEIGASDGGYVKFAGWGGGYGNLVIIKHEDGSETYYGHCSQLNCQKGDAIAKGQTIALSGSTGHSTGPHLHFAVKVNGSFVNPMDYLKS